MYKKLKIDNKMDMTLRNTFSTIILLCILLTFSCKPDQYIPEGKPCDKTPTVTIDGKDYNTVIIDGRCWMTENLDYGTKVSGSQKMANNGIVEKYCYNNDSTNCQTYGGLYQWDEIMQYTNLSGAQGICPKGWHIPTFEEWHYLSEYLGLNYWAGEQLKDKAQGLWKEPNTGAINRTGFTALPAGTHYADSTFNNLSLNAYFWASTEFDSAYAWNRSLGWADSQFKEFATLKTHSRSVRCLRDY